MAHPAYDRDTMINRAKGFFTAHKRAPLSHELGRGFAKTIMKYFGTWSNYINESLGQEASYRHYTDEELIQIGIDLRAKLGRIPFTSDFFPIKASFLGYFKKRFGSYGEYCLRAFGTNQSLEVLKAVAALTEPPCESCSPHELRAAIADPGIANHALSNVLSALLRDGLIVGQKRRAFSLYSLTPTGREYLRQHTHK